MPGHGMTGRARGPAARAHEAEDRARRVRSERPPTVFGLATMRAALAMHGRLLLLIGVALGSSMFGATRLLGSS